MRAAVVQLNSTADKERNLAAAERLVREAADRGAELVALPEKWSVLGTGADLRGGAEPLSGPVIESARGWARELGLHLLAGSVAERVEGRERLANTSVLIGADGEIAAVYRKLHMFDVEVGGVSYRESEHEEAGSELTVVPVEGIGVGMSVCYDLRFPELYRALAVAGARILAVPSAFTATTGRDHWRVLLRARAIENQCFVIAPDQHGTAPPHYDSYGRSMIVDPWGTVLATAADGEGVAIAELDLAAQDRIRAELPSLANRRADVFDAEPGSVGASR